MQQSWTEPAAWSQVFQTQTQTVKPQPVITYVKEINTYCCMEVRFGVVLHTEFMRRQLTVHVAFQQNFQSLISLAQISGCQSAVISISFQGAALISPGNVLKMPRSQLRPRESLTEEGDQPVVF